MDVYSVVEEEIRGFEDLFTKPQRMHFKEYIIGILNTVGKKTIVNINENAGSYKDQSQLNRFVRNQRFDFNLLRNKYNRYGAERVIKESGMYVFLIFDDTIKEVSAKNNIEGVEKYFDHTEKKFVWGHKIFTSCLTNGFGLTAPFKFEIYVRRSAARRLMVPYRKITNMAKETIVEFSKIDCKGKTKVALFDVYYASGRILKACVKSNVRFVTKVKAGRKFIFGNRVWHARDFDKLLPFYREVKVKGKIYEYSEPIEVELEGVGKVFLMRSRMKGTKEVQYYITDINLSGSAILKMYSNRWEIEVMHRDLKQNFGFGDYMMRSIKGIKAHMLLSSIAYAIMSWIRYTIIRPYTKLLNLKILSKVRKLFTLGRLCALFRRSFAKVIINPV